MTYVTLTFKHDVDSVKVNQQAKCLGKGLFNLLQQLLFRVTHRLRTDCSTWTTKMVGKIW